VIPLPPEMARQSDLHVSVPRGARAPRGSGRIGHRDRDQWRRDIALRRHLEALGWTVLQVTQRDLQDPTGFLSDLSAALSR
jgi:hypothetical protein